ncbi:hypothetical protein G6F62_007045 [Rhizopus arrhizus]|nr:hypothetical protein G6F62_007045 [Rhizopus arrhizus]
MSLTEEQMEYKIPIVKEGSKHFFSTNSAKDWDFQIYFESTHDNISKFKNVAKIQRDYDNDLHWITQLEEVPDTIKDYARVLINKNKPSKAILKANMAKHISKGRKMTEQIMNFSNPINGGTIDNINSSNVYFSNETNSNRNLKRKNEAEKDNANEELKQKQDVMNVEPAVPSVWLDFSHYIQSHAEVFHPYSLEANKIIRSGKGVSPKPYLDRVMYNKHMKSRDTKANAMPQSFHQYIDEYIDSVELTMAKKKIKPLSLLLAMNEEYDNDTANLEFLHQLLNQVHKSYASHVDYNSTEDAFNQLFIWPYLDVIAKSIKVDGCDSDFVQGQPILESMTQQLKAVNLYVNDKDQYKSDGLVKLFGLNNLELVLLETSGCFINKDKQKVKFDHHKGVYGALAMLKCIVDDYSYASIETFTKVKVFFLHAADFER